MTHSLILSLLRFTIFLCLSAPLTAQMAYTVPLNADWKMIPVTLMTAPKATDLGQNVLQGGYTAKLPTTVVQTLWQNEVIENPYLLENVRRLEWLEKKDWTFETYFDVDEKVLDAEKADLILRGVDSYASVFLNDVMIFNTDNVFQTWIIDVITLLQPKNNRLRIRFITPYNKNKEFGEAFEFDQDQNFETKLTKSDSLSEETLEKRLVTIGLEGAELKVWNRLKVKEVFIKQNKLTTERADLEAQTMVSVSQPSKINVKMTCGTTVVTKDTFLKEGVHQINMSLVISKPQLWWTKNLGKPFLYDIQTVVSTNNVQSDMCKSRIGLRRVDLTKTQEGGLENFVLQLNGMPIVDEHPSFAYIKAVNELIKQGKWQALVEKAEASNNALIYLPASISRLPPLEFYQLCDERGIMVWQDFMLSNTVYINNNFVKKHLEKEAEKQVSRLRSFACIGVWSGNMGPFKVFGKIVPPDNRIHTISNQSIYEQLFQITLPKLVANYTNQTIYSTDFIKHIPLTNNELNTNLTQVKRIEPTGMANKMTAEPSKLVEKEQAAKLVVVGVNKEPVEQQKPDEKMQATKEAVVVNKAIPEPSQKVKDTVILVSKGGLELNKNKERKEAATTLNQTTTQPIKSAVNTQDVVKQAIGISQDADKVFADISLTAKVENDTFKMTVQNDRSQKAEGYIYVDVFDPKGNHLFADMRYLSVENKRSLTFYKYSVKKMLQGARLSNAVL